MKEFGFRHLPIVSGKQLKGLVSLRDILVKTSAGSARSPERLRARSIRTLAENQVSLFHGQDEGKFHHPVGQGKAQHEFFGLFPVAQPLAPSAEQQPAARLRVGRIQGIRQQGTPGEKVEKVGDFLLISLHESFALVFAFRMPLDFVFGLVLERVRIGLGSLREIFGSSAGWMSL